MEDKYISTSMEKYISDTLTDLKVNDFNYLLEYQKTNTRIKRFDFNMEDVKNFDDKPELKNKLLNKKFYILDYSFIGESTREHINHSDFMFKPLNTKMISENKNVFDNNFIVFINGRMSLYVDILCLEEYTYVLFDINKPLLPFQGDKVMPGTDFNSLKIQKANVTIFFIPNSNRISGPTSLASIKKYNNEIPMNNSNFTHTNPDVKCLSFKYLTFASTNNTMGMVLYDVNNKNGKFTFDITRYHMGMGRFLLDSISIPSLIEEKRLRPGTKTFILPLQGMPIPPENIIPFYRDRYGYRLFDHKLKIKLIYPNIYVLDGDLSKEISLFILYYKPDNTSKYTLDNYAETYIKYTKNIERLVSMNILPDELVNLKLPDIIYNSTDYSNSDYEIPMEYKYDKLQEIFTQFPEYVKTFYSNIDIDKPNSEIVNIQNIDLRKRIRYDNKNEGGHITFDKPMYLFILGNRVLQYSQNVTRYILIDGLFIEPDYTIHKDVFDYIYVDCDKIKPDSIIDIKYNMSYNENKSFYINTFFADYVYNLPTVYTPIRFYNLSFTIDNEQMDTKLLNIYSKDYSGEYKICDDITDNTVITDIKFNINDILLLTKTINIEVDRDFFIIKPPYNDETNLISYESDRFDSKFNTNSYFVYVNGRKCPSHKLYLKPVKELGDKSTHSLINAKINRSEKDKLVIIKHPRMYNQVLFMKKINENGIIDLSGIINRPFDINTFIVYINGRRLYENKIEILSSTIIRLYDIDCLKNLEILERDITTDLFENIDMKNSLSNILYKYVEYNIDEKIISDNEADAFIFNEDRDIEYIDYYNYVLKDLEGLIACDDENQEPINNIQYNFPNNCYKDIAIFGNDSYYDMNFQHLISCDK